MKAVDVGVARADRRAEDDEIERGRDDGRYDALHQRAAHARHLEGVDCENAAPVHFPLTRPTKISSRERCFVFRSLNRIPALLRSFKSVVIPVRSAWVS